MGISTIRVWDQFIGGTGRVMDDEMRAAQGFESAGKDLSDVKRMGAWESTWAEFSRIEQGAFIQHMR